MIQRYIAGPVGDRNLWWLRLYRRLHWLASARRRIGMRRTCSPHYSRFGHRPSLVLAVAGMLAASAAQAEPFSAQVTLGDGQDPPERWAGSVRAHRARVGELGGWLLGSQDVVGLNTFELLTRHPVRPEPARKGLVLRGTADPGALIHVSSDRGDFSFRIDALSTASDLVFLNGLARVSGSSSAERLTDDTRYDDYPSVAVSASGVSWLVWQSYSGGRDEVRIRKLDGSWRTFSPVPGTSGDVWRPQVALDTQDRPWIVWSQQSNGNFDLFARRLDEEANEWGDLVRLSSHPNPDIDHHLIADSRGWLWVVWQGFRSDNSDIFLRYFNGSAWSGEIRVSDHPANDWEPQIATDRHGAAIIVWDSYRNGNYDVFLRRFADGKLGPVTPVAETAKSEAHASVAVDLDGRVWVAWDEAAPNWGKGLRPHGGPGMDHERAGALDLLDRPTLGPGSAAIRVAQDQPLGSRRGTPHGAERESRPGARSSRDSGPRLPPVACRPGERSRRRIVPPVESRPLDRKPWLPADLLGTRGGVLRGRPLVGRSHDA